MPVKREPEQALLEQCLCIAVPTEPGPSRDLVSSSRDSSDPRRSEGSQLHPREEVVVGKEDPGNLAEDMEGGGRGLSLPRIGERWHPGLPATHRPSLQLPLPISDPPMQAEVAAYRHVQAHTSPLAVVSHTKQQQETSMKFKREIVVTTAQHIHTCLPPLHTPFLPGREAEGLCCKAAPTQTPFTCPEPYTAVALPVDAAEQRSTAPAWSLARHPRAGDVQKEPLQVQSPVQRRQVLWICGCR